MVTVGENFTDMEDFGILKHKWLKTFLELPGYSDPFRTTIPIHSGQGFRLIPDKDSSPFRTRFPIHSGHSHQVI
jgi:hypothetical protein